MKESGIWEKFFSVKISPLKTHKIVSICGLKLKFRCDGNRKALEKLRATIRENSVLIVETNTCHYEVIPGYAKYFSELGYNVDVAVYDGGQLDFLCEAVPLPSAPIIIFCSVPPSNMSTGWRSILRKCRL